MTRRLLPNIIITGTPGCGKTSHSEQLAEVAGLKHIPVSDFAKKNGCIDGFDEERDTAIVDEDKLLDEIEPLAEKGGIIIDWHCCEIFPERLIDLVVVLRCNNTVLYDRLKKRGYKDNKISENVEAEIMEVLLQEAKDSYAPEIVVELNSEDIDSLEQNVERISQWIDNWKNDHPEGVSNELSSD
ncbi:hypothetical protein B5S31_g3456 [[Candida] boidinii]|uniref:Unnamed protein product n=1 Tax=Candida boidinii TaxID=5477 RepID=A0ACB5THX0_CANBO|nr:hypothetical protein B5S29_g4412 [[Candida] boidinii]OWB73699.1 hypothetical protein B5S31_g3456 [[Candida] boidinii]OWB80215.1 hypothetical protein B5S32_g4474 [[Candida] boidinii]GME85390.1 unnamed protein product [[Candida] boidinii]GME88802.1 unnamed protein product [[Candida] boidinii]